MRPYHWITLDATRLGWPDGMPSSTRRDTVRQIKLLLWLCVFLSQWKATVRNDVEFATVYRRIYCRKFMTLSNQASRCICKCIRMDSRTMANKANSADTDQTSQNAAQYFTYTNFHSTWKRNELSTWCLPVHAGFYGDVVECMILNPDSISSGAKV